MELRSATTALAAMLATSACVHQPVFRSRPPGETIVLDAIAFECPDEPGWQVTDLSTPGGAEAVSTVWLQGPFAADSRTTVVVEEWPLRAGRITPEELLGSARRAWNVSLDPSWIVTPAPELAFSLEERFGPLSVRGAQRTEAPGASTRAPPRVTHTRAFVPPSRPDRLVRAVWSEPDGDDKGRAGASERAERFFASLRERPPTATASVPDIDRQPSWFITLDGEIASFRGETVGGMGARFGPSFAEVFPASGAVLGAEFPLRIFLGGHDRAAALLTTVGLDAIWGRGPLRVSLGVELGLGLLGRDPGKDSANFIFGPRAGAGLELGRFTLARDRLVRHFYVGVEAGAALPHLYQAELVLGFRMHERGWR